MGSSAAAARRPGTVALVLHTHMPYVEGFGTWPFGEEWLWEAVATSYLPVLNLLDEGAPLTLSLTPVLCDQVEAPGALDRCRAFLRDVRPASHQLDIDAFREVGDEAAAAELERAAAEYAHALAQLDAIGDGFLSRLAPHAAWRTAAGQARRESVPQQPVCAPAGVRQPLLTFFTTSFVLLPLKP